MKKMISMFIIMTSLVHATDGGTFFKKNYKYQEPIVICNDSLRGFWKNDTLSIEDVTPGIFPDIHVQANGLAVFLKWTTPEKTGIAWFDIERSTNLNSWIKLAKLFPLSSAVYEYADTPPLTGIIYYRVQEVDSNSQEQYSDVKAVNINGDSNFLLWPNPVHNQLFIQTHFTTGSVEIIDMAGRFIRKDIIRNTITTIPVYNLSNGMYVLRIKYNEAFIFSVKFIKD